MRSEVRRHVQENKDNEKENGFELKLSISTLTVKKVKRKARFSTCTHTSRDRSLSRDRPNTAILSFFV